MQRFILPKFQPRISPADFGSFAKTGKSNPFCGKKTSSTSLSGGKLFFSIKHLFCGNVKAITCIVDEVLVEEMVQAKSAFDDYEDRNEEDVE